MSRELLAPIIIANWKMNGSLLSCMQFFKQLRENIHNNLIGCEVVICPPFTILRDLAEKIPGTGVKIGGQNCHHEENGAYTGEVSAKMLQDMTCGYVIVGHSERRNYFAETDEIVAKKAALAHKEMLTSIICVGETMQQREQGIAKDVVRDQLLASIPESANDSNVIIAYEPVWAIGSNKIPTSAEIGEIHQHIAKIIQNELKQFEKGVRIVYGGSVSGDNAQEILNIDSVNGLLVGRASLDIDKFWPIIEAASL